MGKLSARRFKMPALSRVAHWSRWTLARAGRFLAPVGDVSFDRMLPSYRDFCRAGRDAGADLVFIETQTDLAEMRCAPIAARETGLSARRHPPPTTPTPELLPTGGATRLRGADSGAGRGGGGHQLLRRPAGDATAASRHARRLSPSGGRTAQTPAFRPPARRAGGALFPEEMAPCMAEILEAGASADRRLLRHHAGAHRPDAAGAGGEGAGKRLGRGCPHLLHPRSHAP